MPCATPPQLAALFAKFNRGVLESFLIEITAQIYLPTDNSRPHLGTTLYDVQVRRPLSVTYHRVPYTSRMCVCALSGSRGLQGQIRVPYSSLTCPHGSFCP